MRLLILTLFLFVSCSHIDEWAKDAFEPESKYEQVHNDHQNLEKQRLIPRPGFGGHLTNRVCTKFYGNTCEQISVRKYSLEDERIRKRLIQFGFACKVGGKRYRICKDKPGLCRRIKTDKCIKWKRKWIFGKKKCVKYEIKTMFLHIKKDYKFMIDGGTECKQGI